MAESDTWLSGLANGGQAGNCRAARWGDQAGLVTACRTWLMPERTWNASAISMTP